MGIKAVAIVISFFMFLFVIELVRRERLTFKYAVGWLFVSAAAIFFSIFEQPLFKFSALIGFELPSNFIFFAMFCIFILLGLLLTVFLCQQNDRNDKMAKKIGMLEFELGELKKLFSAGQDAKKRHE